jgi:hypothetical protein
MTDYINLGLLIVAIIAVVISIIQLRSHNYREDRKLFSQLNDRYVNNKNIQDVVRYLRDFDPEDTMPSSYQVELFLRFFEELGMYLETKSINEKDVYVFFDYYFERFENSTTGTKLAVIIHQNHKSWKYLNVYRDIMTQYRINTLKS